MEAVAKFGANILENVERKEGVERVADVTVEKEFVAENIFFD